MSENKRVTLYDIEAEIPPGLLIAPVGNECHIPIAIWGKDDELITQHSGSEQIAVELFAAAASMRWQDICTELEQPCSLGADLIDTSKLDEYQHARDQFGEWDEIRLRAIKDQKAKSEKASQPCRTSATTPAASPSTALSRS